MENLKKIFRGLLVIGLTLLSVSAFAGADALSPEVRSKEFSLSRKSLALDGYDPVAYFQEGPKKGSKHLSYTFKGVLYYFSSETNRAKFIENPCQYEPQYGGWCAWAMFDGGGRTEANPESYKIIDGKLYVFYDGFFGNTRAQWDARGDDETLIKTADQYWAEQVFK